MVHLLKRRMVSVGPLKTEIVLSVVSFHTKAAIGRAYKVTNKECDMTMPIYSDMQTKTDRSPLLDDVYKYLDLVDSKCIRHSHWSTRLLLDQMILYHAILPLTGTRTR